ncbi:leucine--tRNA ligase [Proteinivorax tanatarense]|uniref:Leucine--tRNA ligase n=1 Tax=Proteinivorax tanatarense TaxID=1260629 RepID=A0AAU7VPP6_9FIRM
MSSYSTKIDEKWQKKWEETNLYEFNEDNVDNKLYCLEMFSYPSGSNLHAGHWYNYGLTDSWARYKRLKGYEVFQPMGFDAFGLPAENYAIKTGVHPKDSTMKNIQTMEKQLKDMGAMFDWNYNVVTCEPDYYKWTQWLFLKLYENNLAFRKNAHVNWCPECNTVLANEQVVEGFCERCENEVTKKKLTQWFFKITEYAEELLSGHKDIDWPDKTKAMQRNWIGKSVGSEVVFKVKDKNVNFTAFTTRPDTLFGVTYAVLAPENPLVEKLTTKEFKTDVDRYIEETKKRSEVERQASNDEKTGVFTGSYATNPINGEKIPIWVADYVLYSYGTGAVMAVPGHDERDFQFATKYDLPIRKVIENSETDDSLPFTGEGKLTNSGEFDGLHWQDGKKAIINKLRQNNLGQDKVQYKLRDWLVSRQRYWGAPIPIIYCDDCGVVPVPEKDLPVKLPYDVDFTPDGISPLKKHEGFINTNCPKCNKKAKRETDTLDTFVDSSWYFLRYPDNKNNSQPFDKKWIDKMLPVDKYVGGPEHACMHLLYARFIHKALRDMGYINSSEPFKSLIHQGIILGPDGNKMSKSKGNVISPDKYIHEYGSDVFRLYLMFGFAYTEGGPWDENGIKPIKRFVDRVERIILTYLDRKDEPTNTKMDKAEKELNYLRHNTIKSVDSDTDKFQFNTSIARMMELLNGLFKYMENDSLNLDLIKNVLEDFIIILAPHAPHFSEEMWQQMGNEYSVFNQSFPSYDEKALIMETQELAVQINGKVRGKIEVDSGATNEEIEKIALSDQKISDNIAGKTVRKVIVIKGRIVNIVAS